MNTLAFAVMILGLAGVVVYKDAGPAWIAASCSTVFFVGLVAWFWFGMKINETLAKVAALLVVAATVIGIASFGFGIGELALAAFVAAVILKAAATQSSER